MTSALLEQASSGNPDAIAAIINRSLQKKHISVSVNLENGNLHIMLDAQKVPSEDAANYIFNGIKSLNIEPAYEVYVYGRKLGEPFATWCHSHELKVRPFAMTSFSDRQSTKEKSDAGLTIRLSGVNNEDFHLDVVQIIGFLGVAITFLGMLSPILTAPIVGTLNYFRNGAEEAVILSVLTALSAFFLIRKNYSWLYGSGIWSFLLVGATFWHYQSFISELKAEADRDLAGNPFRGIADMAMAATGLSWGWVLLFLGTGLVLLAAYLRKRKIDKQAIISILTHALAAVAVVVLSVPYYAITSPSQAKQAYESEAKTYIGSINRGQQAFRLENESFAANIDQLGLGIRSDTENYIYEITISDDDMAAATATAKKKGIRSAVGAVFIVEDSQGNKTTTAITCQSNRPSKSAPSLPSVTGDGQVQCASGSSND